MTRTSCLGTAKCIIFNIYLRRKEILFFVISLDALSQSVHDQPLLDYLWDISRDWERLHGTTTLNADYVFIWIICGCLFREHAQYCIQMTYYTMSTPVSFELTRVNKLGRKLIYCLIYTPQSIRAFSVSSVNSVCSRWTWLHSWYLEGGYG